MEARTALTRYKTAIIANAFFMGVLMAANPIAQSFGWMPAKELIRTSRTRAQRTGRRIREILN